jgi:uncharacterized protein (TIGR02271 family)
VLVRLDHGQEVLVPLNLLVPRGDGSYYLPLGRADLQESRSALQTGETVVVPVMVEELDVQIRRVETGAVRLTKTVHEREELFDTPLWHEEIEVKHVAVNRVVDSPPAVRHEGDTMIVPILEEVLVVEKRLVVKEEIHIAKRRLQTHTPQRVTLRREEASVERINTPHQKESNET